MDGSGVPAGQGAGGGFAPNHEVDELRWVPLGDAARLLSYAHDRRLLRWVCASLT